MDADDILDSMSLSDDELLDSLADDMLQELEAPGGGSDSDDVIEEIHTRAPIASRSRPLAQSGGGPAPDLGRMMAQMMPMMSQMFGGAGGGASAPNALRGPQLSWDEVVRQHVPVDEQSEWLETMRRDELRQRALTRAPPSRAYRQTARSLPSAHLKADTLAASLLHEAVRAAQCEQSPAWRRHHDNLESQLARSGLGAAFARDLKRQLRERVARDPDFLAAKASGRFATISTALAAPSKPPQMLKYQKWVAAFVLLLALWLLAREAAREAGDARWRQLVGVLPMYALVSFGAYSLATIALSVMAVEDCPAAAKELDAQVLAAKADLRAKGFAL